MSDSIQNFTYEFPDMQPRQKLRELILHITKASRFDEKFGKTKLVKILYFSDFTSFRLTGKPITGSKYVKLPSGPMPDDFNSLLAEMGAERDIHVDKQLIPGYSHPQIRVVALREPNYKIFSAQDIAYVDDIIRSFWNSSGTDTADLTHGEVFKLLNPLEAIPYEASIISYEEVTQEDIASAQELIKKYGWDV
ncbi:MAG: DUF4065 domain-containing protein [Chloroflexi bacterium]|nr:DUF4065 domain-containing protein [Chloroflexota bacterium]